jgi:hypothetical protein
MTISSAIGHSSEVTFERVIALENLLLAWRKAARGKRGKPYLAEVIRQRRNGQTAPALPEPTA